MIVTVLSVIHNATTLLFGVYVSAAFLGVRMNRKNILRLLCFSLAIGAVYAASYFLFGVDGTKKLYPFIVHLPLIVFLHGVYRYRFPHCVLSVLTAYLCCQISNWCGIAALSLTDRQWVYYCVRIFITVLTFVLLLRYVTDATAQLLQKPTGSLLILGLIPFVYYLYDYFTGVYTSLLYSGNAAVVEFMGFALCISHILFLFLYFKQYEEKTETEQRNHLMEMQQLCSAKEIAAARRSAHAVTLLRHDMRHFLAHLSLFIQNGEPEKAQACIGEIITAINDTAKTPYCQNEIVNMVLVSYEGRMKENDIAFSHRIRLPETLPVSEVDLTSILSNALENAVHAVLPLPQGQRRIDFEARMHANRLLLSIKNTFAEKPRFADGLPVAAKAGHGFGTQSIRFVTEKLHGSCRFSVENDLFVLQIIL